MHNSALLGPFQNREPLLLVFKLRLCLNSSGQKCLVKVHWVGMSWRDKTNTIMFDEIMTVEGYTSMLSVSLIQFIGTVYISRGSSLTMTRSTPPCMLRSGKGLTDGEPHQSPDYSPIENLGHECKECMEREIKPTFKYDVAKCRKYILHSRKVLPQVIEFNVDQLRTKIW